MSDYRTITGGQSPPIPLDTASPEFLLAWSRKLRLSVYLAGDRCVVRPIRNATPAQLRLHQALIARKDEVGAYLLATRPHPHDSEAAADAASWRVCRMPYEALVSLTINGLNEWLRAADLGRVRYDPGLPPEMGADASPPASPPPTPRPASPTVAPPAWEFRGGKVVRR